MDTKNVILELRTKMGLSQDELAEKVFVTRQAVSRWENGETTPNTETLKLLSKLFDVSIRCLAHRDSLSANAAGCRLRTATSVGRRMAFSMRNTVNGAMPTANICTTI